MARGTGLSFISGVARTGSLWMHDEETIGADSIDATHVDGYEATEGIKPVVQANVQRFGEAGG